MSAPSAPIRSRRCLRLAIGALALACSAAGVLAAPPEIRSSPNNHVPACVTPERLTAFIRTRNTNLHPKFADIGAWYKKHGEAWRVRWDYAFYQMVIETNYLMYKRGDGTSGDVSIGQNNFAGIGASGGGVPGDSYPNVSTGVLAQIQHLVAYSGERVADPVAPRTRLAQDGIISTSLKLRRPVTFADLRQRWATDSNYARSIESIATRFHDQFCKGPALEVAARPDTHIPTTRPSLRPSLQPTPQAGSDSGGKEPDSAAPGSPCRVLAASYGGHKTVLIRAEANGETQFTALTLMDGFERSMIDTYVKIRAPGGQQIGEFATRDAAMSRARQLCPGA